MLSGLVHTCMYVFNFYLFCTLFYIPVPSLNKDFIIIILLLLISLRTIREIQRFEYVPVPEGEPPYNLTDYTIL